jgi:hypothetical protein
MLPSTVGGRHSYPRRRVFRRARRSPPGLFITRWPYRLECGHKTEYQTVNGIPAHGGSIDGPGTVVVDGMLYVSSGSGAFGSTPGKLAYSVEGR